MRLKTRREWAAYRAYRNRIELRLELGFVAVIVLAVVCVYLLRWVLS